MSLKGAWDNIKNGGSFVDLSLQVLDVFKDFEIVHILNKMGGDATKVTLNKGFHKREYGQAFSKLTRKQRDAIRDIQRILRRKGFLENFILNVSLYGETVEDSTELLRVLAEYDPREAYQLIDDMDLEKEPVKRGKAALKKAQEALHAAGRIWVQIDNEVAASLDSLAATIDRKRVQWKANNFGIEQPFYRRRIRITKPSRKSLIWACAILLAIIVVSVAVHAFVN